MHRFSATIRITIGLTLLSASVLLLARTLGVGPDEHEAALRGRHDFCEMLAMHSSLLVNRDDFGSLRSALKATIRRHPEIFSIGLRKRDGRRTLHIDRSAETTSSEATSSNPTVISVP